MTITLGPDGIIKESKNMRDYSDDSSYTMLSEVKNKKPQENWVTYGLSESSDYNRKLLISARHAWWEILINLTFWAQSPRPKVLVSKDEVIQKRSALFACRLAELTMFIRRILSIMIDFAHTPNGFRKNIKYGQADYKRQNNPCFW